jgi:hypothetical protein
MKYKVVIAIVFTVVAMFAQGQNAFEVINNGVEDSRKNLETKNNAVLALLDTIHPTYAAIYKQSMLVHAKADSLVNYIQQLKIMLIVASDGDSSAVKGGLRLADVKNIDDYDTPTILLASGRKGIELKQALQLFKNHCATIIDKADAPKVSFMVNIADPVFDPEEPEIKTWQQHIFYHTPLAAAIAHLSKLQGDVRHDESVIITYLYNKTRK